MKYPIQIAIIILLSLAVRIPQLAGPALFLDGDECLVGLMAKHIYQGRDFPLYFWGQQYGFSFIECLFIIPFYAVLGVNALAVKLGALSLWITGVCFLFKTLRLINTSHRLMPFFLTLVFTTLPAWAIWSMKARGGYITAFTLSTIALYLVLHPILNKKMLVWLLMGALLNFIYQSNMFWLVGVLPVIFYQLISEKKIGNAVIMLLTTTIIVIVFDIYKHGLTKVYVPPIVFPDKTLIVPYIKRIPAYLYNSLHGNYYFTFVQPPNLFCAASAVIFSVILFTLPLLAAVFLLFRRKGNYLFIASVLFIPACLFVTLFSPDIHGRYLLPITGFAFIPLQLLANKTRNTKPLMVSCATLIVAGTIAVVTFWNFEFLPWRKDTIFKTITYLDKNNVKYVFCSDCMVPWQINFYSNERITARMPYIPERYPPNGDAVNNALARGEKVAVMYYESQTEKLHVDNPARINDFGVGLNPTKEELAQYFYFPDIPNQAIQ
jgi:hypothetical protein